MTITNSCYDLKYWRESREVEISVLSNLKYSPSHPHVFIDRQAVRFYWQQNSCDTGVGADMLLICCWWWPTLRVFWVVVMITSFCQIQTMGALWCMWKTFWKMSGGTEISAALVENEVRWQCEYNIILNTLTNTEIYIHTHTHTHTQSVSMTSWINAARW